MHFLFRGFSKIFCAGFGIFRYYKSDFLDLVIFTIIIYVIIIEYPIVVAEKVYSETHRKIEMKIS